MTTTKHRILITMEGGVIQAIDNIPAGTVIEVRDFDRDGDREHPSWSEEHQAFVGEWEGGKVASSAIATRRFRVKVIARTLETYEVDAASEEEAGDSWAEGRLIGTDDDLENEILEVEAL